MHKILGTAVLGALLASTSTTSFAAKLKVWEGAATVTTNNGRCAGVGVEVGAFFTSVFRPRLNPEEPVSSLTLLDPRSAQIYVNDTGPDQMIGQGTYKGKLISSDATQVTDLAGGYSFQGSSSIIKKGTQFLTIKGQLTHFLNDSDCTIVFRAHYTPRP